MICKKRKNIASRMLSICLSAAIAFPLLPIDDNRQQIKAAENSIKYGDVNGDNNINVLDIILLKSFMTEKNTKNFDQKSADIDKDSSITCKDALLLSAY